MPHYTSDYQIDITRYYISANHVVKNSQYLVHSWTYIYHHYSSSGLLQASIGHTRLSSHTTVESDHANHSLPSLVDISKTSNTRGSAGRLGQMERQMLNIEGHVAPLVVPPDSTHLPPLTQQRSSHSALPPRHTWPITSDMLEFIK